MVDCAGMLPKNKNRNQLLLTMICVASMLSECITALLSSPPVLTAPDFSKLFNFAAWGIRHPVCYFSWKVNKHQARYSTADSVWPSYEVFILVGGGVTAVCCIVIVVWVGLLCTLLTPSTAGAAPKVVPILVNGAWGKEAERRHWGKWEYFEASGAHLYIVLLPLRRVYCLFWDSGGVCFWFDSVQCGFIVLPIWAPSFHFSPCRTGGISSLEIVLCCGQIISLFLVKTNKKKKTFIIQTIFVFLFDFLIICCSPNTNAYWKHLYSGCANLIFILA